MRRKKILLQCQGIAYYYMGLAAIYTKYPDRNVDIDVLFSSSNVYMDFEPFIEKLRKSKYINNIFSLLYRMPPLFKTLINEEKSIWNYLKFYTRQVKSIKRYVREKTNLTEKYSDIFFSQELGNLLITSLKFLYPKASYVVYGDGAGLITGKCFYGDDKKEDYNFIKIIKPDEIISLLPYMFDDSMDITNIPIKATDKNVYIDIVKNDEAIQNEINDYKNYILSKYKNCQKSILLTSLLDRDLFKMSKQEQISVYTDIIDKYCSDESILVLKTHPTFDDIFINEIKEKCTKKVEILEIPENLKKYPIEIFNNLLKDFDNIITFISSSEMSLKYIYGINCIVAEDIIQKYPMRHYTNIILKRYQTIIDRIPNWDKKSIIFKDNIRPLIEQIMKNVTD